MKKEKKIESTEIRITDSLETEEQTPPPRDLAVKKPERIAMSDESLSRLDSWKRQVEGARPAVEVSRRDLVEWLISEHPEALSNSEVKELSETHYNELRFLQFAIRELKAAKSQGKTIHLQDMVAGLPILSRPKERIKKKVILAELSDVDQASAKTEVSPLPSFGSIDEI
jgi:hypothetical protein